MSRWMTLSAPAVLAAALAWGGAVTAGCNGGNKSQPEPSAAAPAVATPAPLASTPPPAVPAPQASTPAPSVSAPQASTPAPAPSTPVAIPNQGAPPTPIPEPAIPSLPATLPAVAGGMPSTMPSMSTPTAAIAIVLPTTGNKVHGVVTFSQTPDGVKVVADLADLPPGKHGFHIHEFGDTTDVDKAMSEGGHFDPAGTHHHELIDPEHADGGAHHAGDMGNVTGDDSGKAHLELTLAGVTIAGPLNPIAGHAVIVHEKADDGGQPTGNAGGRIGYGVIGIAKPK